ncbi:unnamed protein product [Phytophthora fragariaefolia]|uniref:Unnamed protein product n=1 Tax=Phytophthora fragariaefolia TaxID=1490495 RepID=A0A9W7D2B9_9STRA|nr:unnamed protein product [Phytophthora fragariaefolia]
MATSSAEGATHVRGHPPRTLDKAVELAVPRVGEYSEGYDVGVDTAMARWDEREASRGRGSLAAGDKEQSATAGNLGTVVNGYGPSWGTIEKPPRYDTAGRPVLTGKAGSGEWWRAIPPGYQLVPAGTPEVQRRDSQAETVGGRAFGPERGKRPASGDHPSRQRSKTFKIEGAAGSSATETAEVSTDHSGQEEDEESGVRGWRWWRPARPDTRGRDKETSKEEVSQTGNGAVETCTGHLRAVQAPAVKSLPTARVRIFGEEKRVKLGTGAQYCVAGVAWQAYGERLNVLPPVDITGSVAKVLGVWWFRLSMQYEQIMVVDALIVEGVSTEFLLGEDWMLDKGVKMTSWSVI